jgi:hypothetical protein
LPSSRISKTQTPLTHFHSNFPVDFEFIIRSEPGIAGTFDLPPDINRNYHPHPCSRISLSTDSTVIKTSLSGTFVSKCPAAGTAVTRQTNGTASEMPPDRQIASFKCGMAQGGKAAPKCPAMKQQTGL